LVLSVEGLTNDVLASRLLPDVHVSFAPFVTVLERAPAASLYPVFRAMSVETNFLERGQALLDTARARLALARGCLGLDSDAPEGLDECAVFDCDPTECLQTAKDLRSVSTLMTVIGRILVAWGETKFNGEFQVHGYVGGSIYNNRKKKLGNIFVGAADALGGMATSLETKVRYCVLRRDQLAILDNQRRIMDKLGICKEERRCDAPCGDDAKCPADREKCPVEEPECPAEDAKCPPEKACRDDRECTQKEAPPCGLTVGCEEPEKDAGSECGDGSGDRRVEPPCSPAPDDCDARDGGKGKGKGNGRGKGKGKGGWRK
jgi:hypothetical protein